MNEAQLRELVPAVIGILRRRGADFAAAEDAVQEALITALSAWEEEAPTDPQAWLVTVAWRKFLDQVRAEDARRRREELLEDEPAPGPVSAADDSLQLFFLCAHPSLTPASAVALTLRAVGWLTTAQIPQAYLVPEATMAQRISRAKRTVAGQRLDRPGDVATVLRVLYLIFNEGYSGDVDLAAEAMRLARQLRAVIAHPYGDGLRAPTRLHPLLFNGGYSGDVALAAEAIRLARQLRAVIAHPEVDGLLALMLLHHARRAARFTAHGALVPLEAQDRTRWDTALIAEGIGILQAALGRDRLGEFQVQAAIAALHADAPTAAETDWPQILEWYDELVALTDNPIARLNRVVALGQAEGPRAGLAAL